MKSGQFIKNFRTFYYDNYDHEHVRNKQIVCLKSVGSYKPLYVVVALQMMCIPGKLFEQTAAQVSMYSCVKFWLNIIL